MKIMIAALLALMLSVPPLFAGNELVSRALKEVHTIEMGAIVAGKSKCSATAIGPHALLIASHCEEPTNEVDVDGGPAVIISLMRDDNDHTILLVSRKFDNYAKVNQALPQVADDVFIIGSPAEHDKVYRRGYVVQVEAPSDLEEILTGQPAVMVYDLNAYRGDSGAGVFNDKGEVTGVISQASIDHESDSPEFELKLMQSLQLAFTAGELKKAQTFGVK